VLTLGKLIELAVGKDESSHVDTSIPQGVFDNMSTGQREDVAGWWYERYAGGTRSIFGRLLTKTECWDRIVQHLNNGTLLATGMGGGPLYDISFVVKDWPCLRKHVNEGHIALYTPTQFEEEKAEYEDRQRRMERRNG
jgi:hypothetical protein